MAIGRFAKAFQRPEGWKPPVSTKIGKMSARGFKPKQISEELTKMGEEITPKEVTSILKQTETKNVIEQERERIASLIPKCVENYDFWITKAKRFQDDKQREIAFRATTKVLESHGLVSGAPSEQVKISINKQEITLSPVVEKLLEGFMDKLRAVKPVEPEYTDVEFEVIGETKAI
jgi:hypothetical protein